MTATMNDFTLARLTLVDRINPALPITKTYDHNPDNPLDVDTIKQAVDAERDPMTRLRNAVRETRSDTDGIDRQTPPSALDLDDHVTRDIDPPDGQITP